MLLVYEVIIISTANPCQINDWQRQNQSLSVTLPPLKTKPKTGIYYFFNHIINRLNKRIFKSSDARWMIQLEIKPLKNMPRFTDNGKLLIMLGYGLAEEDNYDFPPICLKIRKECDF